MTVLSRDHITADELVTIMRRHADQLTLRIALSVALRRNERERHANVADLTSINAAIDHLQRLYPEDGA